MKKKVGLLLLSTSFLFILCGTIMADYDILDSFEENISIRVYSMGYNLNGFVTDTITDMLWNPARLSETNFLLLRIPDRFCFSVPSGLKNIRIGGYLEGKYDKSISNSEEQNLSPINSIFERKDERLNAYYKGAILFSKTISSTTSIGLRGKYELKSSETNYLGTQYSERDDYYTDNSFHTTKNTSNYKNKSIDTLSIYSFTLGSVSKWGKNSLEVLLSYGNSKAVTSDIYTNSSINRSASQSFYIPDSSTYYSFNYTSTDRINNSYKTSNPDIFGGGFNFSKNVSMNSTFHVLGTIYSGTGDAEKIANTKEYYDRCSYYSYTSPDTSWVLGDSTKTEDEKTDTLITGSNKILVGSFGIGQEINISKQVLFAAGIKVNYENEEFNLTGTSREKIDDTTDVNTNITEKNIARNAYLYIPLGIEYKPVDMFCVRCGVTMKGSYTMTEDSTNMDYSKYENVSGMDCNFYTGFGFNFKRAVFNVYTYELGNISAYRLEAMYNF